MRLSDNQIGLMVALVCFAFAFAVMSQQDSWADPRVRAVLQQTE